MESNVMFALSLTLFAGLATGLGSLVSLFCKQSNTRFLAASLGFSAGVMMYVSMVEIFSKSKDFLISAAGEKPGAVLTAAAFFLGIIIIGFIDYAVPSTEGDIGMLSRESKEKGTGKTLKRMGFITALAIGIHNFPEGMVTFTSALQDPKLGVALAFAIAIHNIPEGIATAAPIFFATGSKKRAFWISMLSGLAEPMGAIIGYLVLRPFFNDMTFGILFGIISGIIVFISIEELLPMAREIEKSKITIISFVLGMAVMAVSLLLFL